MLKFFKRTLIVLLLLLITVTILNISPWTISKVKGENKFITNNYPLIIPHGGAKELFPENSVYAYEKLVDEYDAGVLEIDLVLTKDNIIISHHDLDLEMSSNSLLNDKLIKDYTYDEIISAYQQDDYFQARSFVDPNGNKPYANISNTEILEKMVPAKLEEIFIKNGKDILYMLEIKDAPTSNGYIEGSKRFELASKELVRLVEQYELEEYVVLASFSDEVTKVFKDLAPKIKVGAAMNEVTKFSIFSAFHIDFFWKVNSEILILPVPDSMTLPANLNKTLNLIPKIFRNNIAIKQDGSYKTNLANKQIIKDAHRKNMAVMYWTVNDIETMEMLIDLKVDGIITDRPDLLTNLINELKLI